MRVFKKYIYILVFIITILQLKLSAQHKITLKESFAIARKNNLLYNAEKLNVDMSQTDVIGAKSNNNPSVNLSYQQVSSSKYLSENTGFFNSNNNQLSYQVSKSFQIKGQKKYKIESANQNLNITVSNLMDYERNLLFDVANKWLDVWYANEKYNIIQRAKTNSDTLLKVNTIRLKNQVITNTEYLRTQIIFDQYALKLKASNQELSSVINDLKISLNTNDSLIINNDESIFYIPITFKFDSLYNYALENRTDIKTNINQIKASKTDELYQKSLAYPEPEFGFSYSNQNIVPYIGAYLSIPLPIFNKNQAAIQKSQLMIRKNETIFESSKINLKTELTNAINEYQTYKFNFEKYKDIYIKSENVLNSVKLSYTKGGTTIIDYLEAEHNWFDIQNEYYETLYNFNKSYIKLLFTSNLIQTIN